MTFLLITRQTQSIKTIRFIKKKKTEPAQDSSKPLKKKKQSNCEKVQTFLSSDRCDNGCFLAIAAVGDDMELK